MSTLKVAAINHPSASSGGLAISASGNVTGAGLDLITTQSFSAVSSVSVNNCFSATYDNYRIMVDGQASGVNASLMRFRTSGTDNSGANYTYQTIQGNGTQNASAARTTGATSFDLFYLGSGARGAVCIEVISPFAALSTRVMSNCGYDVNTPQYLLAFGGFTATTSFDGFTFYPASGTITGSLLVFGYRK